MAKNNNKKQPARELSASALFELPKTKAVLKPLITAGEEIAKALQDGKIDFAEWAKIVWEGIPVASALKDLQAFVAETQIINTNKEAKTQLLEWFKTELELPQENVEWVVEHTIELAMTIWNYIVGMQQHFVKAKMG